MKNCCANCEWSISPEDEDNILRDMGYSEDDESRPHAGDCCMGMEKERVDYYCDHHIYNLSITYGIDKEIVNDSRHAFVYSYPGNARDVFIEEMCVEYPFVLDNNCPIVINVDDFVINDKNVSNEINMDRLLLVSYEYLNLSICYSITKQLNECEAFENYEVLLNRVNKLFLKDECDDIKSISELLSVIKESMDAYKKYYDNLLNNNKSNIKITDLKIPYMDASTYTRLVKSVINNNSYFVLVFNCDNAPFIVCNAINSFISSRINKDMSIKVMSDFNSYKPLYDMNHNIIQSVHDYDIVELDDNYSDSMKLIRRKYENN